MNSYTSLCFDGCLSPEKSQALLEDARAFGLRAQWTSNQRFSRTDVLLAGPGSEDFAARYPQARAFTPPIMALAIEPRSSDALPALAAALSGAGAPVGSVRAEVRYGAVLLEFAPARSPWSLLRDLIDVELLRFGNPSRDVTVLSPHSIEMAAQIAAAGLECRELDSSRVLESLIDRAGS